jgi:hypothetical protein
MPKITMTIHEEAIAKIQQLPEPLVVEINDFIDFLIIKNNTDKRELWQRFTESLEIAEVDFSDYLSNLEDYETRLANGEIQW